MSSLFNFLQRNQIEQGRALPLVHSTEAYYIKQFMKTGKITTAPCKFFKKEKLSYFFVGRPAFKRPNENEVEYWELPIFLIVDFKTVKIKRIFPFDSGAFKRSLYPSYISIMELDEFEVARDPNSVEKLIGTFFTSNSKYFRLEPRSKQSFESKFDVEVLNEEVKALHLLIGDKRAKVDDRRFAIEVQSDQDMMLTSNSVLAVVLPEIYLGDPEVIKFIEEDLEALPITYPILPLNKNYYYQAIYTKVDQFFKDRRLFDV